MIEEYDIAIFGGGISGFSAALRLQSKGFRTVVFEAHGQLGGCAGFFSKKKVFI
jgi:phytoene dehydrogenase-like protein